MRVDPINHPPHYTQGGIEVIDAIEAWGLGFRLANVVKYVARADHKGKRLEDLRKAQWYLSREIAKSQKPLTAEEMEALIGMDAEQLETPAKERQEPHQQD